MSFPATRLVMSASSYLSPAYYVTLPAVVRGRPFAAEVHVAIDLLGTAGA